MEGELGPVLASRAIQRVTDIPPDTRFAFSAVTGDILPREIVTIPVVAGSDVVAVISLASVRPYRPEALGLLEAISGTLTARVNGVLSHRQLQDLADQLERQNRELDAQKQELAVNNRRAPAPLRNGRQRLILYADRASLEAFAADGLTYLPYPINLDPNNRSLAVSAKGGTAKFQSLEVHELKSSWPAARSSP